MDSQLAEMTPHQRIDCWVQNWRFLDLPEKVNRKKTDLLLASEVTRIAMKVK